MPPGDDEARSAMDSHTGYHEEDDWAWRRRIRAHPTLRPIYRTFVGALGLVITVVGLIMVPLPGPGWLVVILGLLVLASEFERARAVEQFVRRQVHRWQHWIMGQRIWVRLLVGTLTFAFVAAVFWATLKIGGIPRWVPGPARDFARDFLWLGPPPTR